MPFPYDPDAHEGIISPPLEAETDLGPPGFVLNVSLPSPQVEEPPLRYLGSLGRSGAGPRSSPASLSRNPIPSLRRDGSGSLSSLAISGVELRDLHSNNSTETSGHKSSEPQRTPDIASNTNNSSKETPHQRVSFDSPPPPVSPDKRGTVNAPSRLRSVVYSTEFPKAPSRQIRKSDPPIPSSPILRAFAYIDRQKDSPKRQAPGGSQSPSKPRSRATSPLRILQQWSGLHRPRGPPEERFVPVDPFAARSRSKSKHKSSKPCRTCSSKQQQHEHSAPQTTTGSAHTTSAIMDRKSIASSDLEYGCIHVLPLSFVSKAADSVHFFMIDTLPRHFYLTFLLHLPPLYFSRVARIFEDAEVSKPDIQRMIETGGGGGVGFFDIPSSSEGGFGGRRAESSRGPSMSPGATSGIGISSLVGIAPASSLVQHQQQPLPYPEDWAPPFVSPALMRFKGSWETFIDSLLREWKTLNLVSVLLLSAIMTFFQVNAALTDPVIRNTAFLSLICALMSLSYGCMYIIRFGSMKSMYRASRWAEEARKSKTSLLWNVWVFLAMPAVWMAWSMIWFIVSILSFVWRTGAVNDPVQSAPLSVPVALIPRIVITAVFVVGLVYFVLIVRTLQSYGSIHGNVGWGSSGAAQVDSGAAKPSYDAAERGRARAGSDGAVLERERRGRERERRSGSGSDRGQERKEEKVAGLGLSNMERPESLDREK